MLTVVLVVLGVLAMWALLAVAVALLAGGIIHARDHRDVPSGSRPGQRAAARFGAPAAP